MPHSGARGRIAPVVLAVALLGAPAALAAPTAQSRLSRPTVRGDFATLSTRAEAARAAGRLDEAVSSYRQALSLRATWKEGWWALGAILYEQDAYRDAARAFRRLVALDPKNGTALLMWALCEYQLDADASALAHLQTAKALGVQADGFLPQIMTYHEGMLLLRLGRYERAIEALKPLVGGDVEDPNLDLALGMGVLLMRPKDAPPEGSPSRATVMAAGRAERHHLSKLFTAAKGEYEALVRDAPAFANVHYAYGRFLLATDDLEGGIQEFLQEIAAHPDHIRARVQVAAARYRLDPAAALPYAREVVQLAPDYPFGHYLLGLIALDTGDLTLALPQLESAARMVPDDPQFQFALGNAYARAGRADDAARARAAFVRLNKNASSESGDDALRRIDLDSATRRPNRPNTPNHPNKKPLKN
jgi:tetratricopeptide (TPR) repeat protein